MKGIDVNPPLRKDVAAQLAYPAVVGKATAAPTSPAAKSGSASNLAHLLLIAGAGLVVLAMLIGIVLAVVLTRRKHLAPARAAGPAPAPAPATQHRPVP